MSNFDCLQEKLSHLIPMPNNLPIIYLLGDTGAGKTCIVRQLLGTTKEKFPSVRRVRTTVAPTEFIITTEPEFKAAFVLKSEEEVSRYVTETLEQALMEADKVLSEDEGRTDVMEALGDSPDQRFKLRCFLNEAAREKLTNRIVDDLAPRVRLWVETNFPAETDRSTAIELATECDDIRAHIEKLHAEIMDAIRDQVAAVCSEPSSTSLPEASLFSSNSRGEFLQKLKNVLSVDEGSISPVIEKARIRGPLKSSLLPENTEIVVIDGEGIGHDAKESRVLSARHLDYFNISDTIILVEDSETPFTRGGKGALSTVAKNGYLPNLYVAFSRLDKVHTEKEGREFQRREVDKSLRNVLRALKDEGVQIPKTELECRYFADMDQMEPDDASKTELQSLVASIIEKHAQVKSQFVAPSFDFELLESHLSDATRGLRRDWDDYIQGEVDPAPWQTQKAFTNRMSLEKDEYSYLKPVAGFHDHLITGINTFLLRPVDWADEITENHKGECLQLLTQVVSQRVLEYVRTALVTDRNPKWKSAANLRGTGSTPIRSRQILAIIRESAPEPTGENAKQIKDSIKEIIENSINACESGVKLS